MSHSSYHAWAPHRSEGSLKSVPELWGGANLIWVCIHFQIRLQDIPDKAKDQILAASLQWHLPCEHNTATCLRALEPSFLNIKTKPIKTSLWIFTAWLAAHCRNRAKMDEMLHHTQLSQTDTGHLPPFYKFSTDGPHTRSWQDIPIKYTELQFELCLFQLPDHLLHKLKVFLTVADEGIKHLFSTS